MLQDDDKRLSKWLSTHGCARALAQEAAEEIKARRNNMNIINYTRTLGIEVYTKSNCPNCVAAKELLKSKGLVFDERDMDDPEQRERFVTANPGIRQMPQIFINSQRVGGIDGLRAALKQLGL